MMNHAKKQDVQQQVFGGSAEIWLARWPGGQGEFGEDLTTEVERALNMCHFMCKCFGVNMWRLSALSATLSQSRVSVCCWNVEIYRIFRGCTMGPVNKIFFSE